jgi:hypothetical protein
MASAKTIGVPIVEACNGQDLDTGWSLLSNCVHELTDTDIIGSSGVCTLLGQCLSATAATCCSPEAIIMPSTDCSVGYYCAYNPSPNDQLLCNTAGCNCDALDECTTILYDVPVCSPSTLYQYVNGSTAIRVYQSWQFFGNGVWYTTNTAYDSTFFGPGTTTSRGIGFNNAIWTLSGDPTTMTNLTNATLVVRNFSSITATMGDPLRVVSVVPSDQLTETSTDWIYSSSVQLVFDFDRLVGSTAFNAFSSAVAREITQIQWCVGVSESKLIIEPCLTSAQRWYVDPITTLVHPAGNPLLCPTAFDPLQVTTSE